ncbi:sigma-70 family RNA polymerase sigma factor [Bacillus alkalisoli]|uniref:sigma-70 family RNA polymerase sigma factor n=1 Tax=Bacillus alkalisoli TaxID=2011008 RepID=UPI000C24FAB0|nr:sigma-70 family RNA polymerase sigma factor [Bacillus alkalisoli]
MMHSLLALFKQNGLHTYEKLVVKEQEKLYKIAYSYVKNEHDSLDIVQESILKGYKNFYSLKEKKYFSTWITRITIHTSIDFVRRQNREVTVELQDFMYKEEKMQQQITSRMDLEKVFDRLNTEQKTIILLRFYKNYSIKEIADFLNKPEGSVKSKLHRTLAQMRSELEKDDSYEA